MTTSDEAEARQELLRRIQAKRATISAFVRELRPRAERQGNLSIILSGVASVLTLGPAVGGTSFTEGLQHLLAIPDDSLIWRGLCLGAAVASAFAATLTNLHKSQDVAGRLTRAQAANAELEGLHTLIEFGHLPIDEAAKLYQQYITGVPFVSDSAS